MTKALFINGSQRKNGNTAQLLKRAMDGAREAGAEVELVNLYDRSMNYKGCMSCFACKLKGGKKGVCSFKDDLQPILQKAVEADVLVCGSPNYCGYPSAALRAETHLFCYHLYDELSQRRGLSPDELPYPDGHLCPATRRIRSYGDTMLLRHLSVL